MEAGVVGCARNTWRSNGFTTKDNGRSERTWGDDLVRTPVAKRKNVMQSVGRCYADMILGRAERGSKKIDGGSSPEARDDDLDALPQSTSAIEVPHTGVSVLRSQITALLCKCDNRIHNDIDCDSGGQGWRSISHEIDTKGTSTDSRVDPHCTARCSCPSFLSDYDRTCR